MSAPTFERFNYALRPAKNMERKMLCEGVARLARIAPLKSYKYVGFGSVGFVDFSLIHQRLGIDDMVSIERVHDAQQRIEFNRPYSCIRMKWGESNAILPTLSWKKRSIAWLDYDKPLDSKILIDAAFCAGNMRSGSVIIITVNAEPGPVEADPDLAAKRLNLLKARVGEKKVRLEVTGADLAGWGLAQTSRNILSDEITRTLNSRNGALPKSHHISFHQLFNFHYKDGTRMLTIGGVLLDPADRTRLRPDRFTDISFYRNGEDPYRIEVPILTLREIRYLDERLPRIGKTSSGPNWIPEEERKRYAAIYRYFPSYSEVEP